MGGRGRGEVGGLTVLDFALEAEAGRGVSVLGDWDRVLSSSSSSSSLASS